MFSRTALSNIRFKVKGVDIAFLILLSFQLCTGLYYWVHTGSLKPAIVSAAFSLVFFVAYLAFNRIRNRFSRVPIFAYAFVLACSGVLYMLIFAPGVVPDELYHYICAYELSNILMFMPADGGTINMRQCDLEFFNNPSLMGSVLRADSANDLLDHFSLFSQNSELVKAEMIHYDFRFSGNPPQDRLASAIGILLGRILNLGAIPTFYLGRLFNFAQFVTFAVLAVKAIPLGKPIIMAVSLLPMSLHLNASYSYDSFIIGSALLYIALLVKFAFSDCEFSLRDKVALCALIALLAPCKGVYFLLGFLVLLVPAARFSSKRESVLFKAGLITLCLATTLLFKASGIIESRVVDPAASLPEGMGARGTEAGYFYSVGGLLSHPSRMVGLMLNTAYGYFDWYLGSLLGYNLGWFQVEAPFGITAALLLLVLGSVVSYPKDARVLSAATRVVFLCISALGVLLIVGVFALTYTFDTEATVQGVQGRYFIPFLPLILLALRSRSFSCTADLERGIPLAFCVVSSVYMTWFVASLM